MQPQIVPKIQAELISYYALSRREVEIALYVAAGLKNREVANRLCLSEKTIKFHLGNVFKKMKITARSHLIYIVSSMGGLSMEFREKAHPTPLIPKDNGILPQGL